MNSTASSIRVVPVIGLPQMVLTVPFTTTNQVGKAQRFTEGYVVLLSLTGPKFSGPKLDLFVGDYEVPEYGGWAKGIYFKVYDPALLSRLDGREFRYRFMDKRIQNLGRKLEVPPLEKLRLERELDVIRKRD